MCVCVCVCYDVIPKAPAKVSLVDQFVNKIILVKNKIYIITIIKIINNILNQGFYIYIIQLWGLHHLSHFMVTCYLSSIIKYLFWEIWGETKTGCAG